MKFINSIFLLFFLFASTLNAQQWKAIPGRIASTWADKVDPIHPLPEYPRPHLVRKNNWKNLNGLWDYAILPQQHVEIPKKWDGKILVPFAIESSLSGVGKRVGDSCKLWYHTKINLPKDFKNTILLHFGAVDWRTEVFINGRSIGKHEGGFDPFSFDITPYLRKGETQELIISVWDPTDKGYQPRGKQVVNPKGIWYTPVTGIWQTVWLENVPKTYIQQSFHTPNIDAKTLAISTKIAGALEKDSLRVTAFEGNTVVSTATQSINDAISLKIQNQKLWTPHSPFLYDLKFEILRKGKVIDVASSYFAMRKTSIGIDKDGTQRMLLNNEFVFQYGPLDQGWWPDGLYTAPTYDALKFDIIQTKEMGFNMIRKHIKVEPALWYYECDRQGLLVWQDMPSGDLGNKWEMRVGDFGGTDKDRSPASEASYRAEWKNIMEALHNFPSIVVWVPFNEAWGQFKTKEITEWTQKKDPSRLVNSASGGNFEITGHLVDLHNYPEPKMPRPDVFGKTQALVLGEFGGLGLPIINHTWQDANNWGYQSFKTADELFAKYQTFIDRLEYLIQKGLSAAVYTQTTDVEIETNGLMTYDRKVIKIPAERLKQVNQKLYNKQLVVLK